MTYFLSRWLFLRLLGVVYLAAFLSLEIQVDGLIGSLPAREYLAQIQEATGWERFYLAPTLCWLGDGDLFLSGLCIGGAVLAGLLILGLAPVPILFLLWACYLSLTIVGQEFFSYQWDALLLETGLLAVFFAPLQWRPRLAHESPPSPLMHWLLRWLLFRLIFASGVCKLLSGDATWRHLTALQYHYETQPLPTWTSWYMRQLPAWLHALSVLLMFFAELVVPLGIFGPRRVRIVAFFGIVGLQVLIAGTGNYGYFNLLTVALSVPLLDDKFFPARCQACLTPAGETSIALRKRGWPGWLLAPLAACLVAMSTVPFLDNLGLTSHWPAWLVRAYGIAASFHSANQYGLFAIMTTHRYEIIVQGSDDGQVWLPYEFKWKPGDVTQRPSFTGLHMPRLDWQMWFAALGNYRQSPWFSRFLVRLLEGKPEVQALVKRNPFSDKPPRYLRANRYHYRFTDAAARAEAGAWWRREELGLYCPIVQRPASEPGQD
jgi:hypothetical protein